LSKEEESKVMQTLAKDKDIFSWSAFDLQGVSRDIIQLALEIDPKIKGSMEYWQPKRKYKGS